ncbi:LysR family transcriptional regulator [Dechloromonas sp. ZY10]|uniref:LysR family transcriptional regulator n=1 Tax=Dechloromonas aquae TaxID=2664436 RepID=UPI003526CA65
MRMLRDMEVFVLAADTGSLSAAARRLDMSPAAASLAVKRLEDEVAAALFLRTTRSLRLTAAGQVFLEPCRQALQLLVDGRDAALSDPAAMCGVLQLSVPSDLGRNILLDWLDEFQLLHPKIQLRLQLSDRPTDIYRQHVDLALRYGALPDSSLVALPVAAGNRRILCAAPSYLARAGTPAEPQALVEHNCLCFTLADSVHDRWQFSRGGKLVSVQVKGDRVADDGDAVRRWALAGHGIACKSALDVAADLQSGRLLRLCPEWQAEASPLHLVCAERRQISPLVQALRHFLGERCASRLAGLALD